MKSDMDQFSLYIHIPYCLQKCIYCNFNSDANPNPPVSMYVKALQSELLREKSLGRWDGKKLKTIYFGGGTPSLFDPKDYEPLFETIDKTFGLSDVEEITLEANPGTLNDEKLLGYKELGINRLSLGIQTFQPKLLKIIGRVHTVFDSHKCIIKAREIGFDNLTLDLMYGLPYEALTDLKLDLQFFKEIKPNHISAYCLSVENGTPLAYAVRKHELILPTEDDTLLMLKTVNEELKEAGYEHYEISNYALPGFKSKHNSAYWEGQDYLGLGAGAHSFNSTIGEYGCRFENEKKPKSYIEKATFGSDNASYSERLTRNQAMTEFFMLGLRRKSGVSISEFENRFNATIVDEYTPILEKLQEQNLITLDGDTLALTEHGYLFADSVMAEFVKE